MPLHAQKSAPNRGSPMPSHRALDAALTALTAITAAAITALGGFFLLIALFGI